jgi:uncharacterized protein
MLRVRTSIKASTKHGTGLFADERIPKGTTTWQYDPEFDTAFTDEQVSRMPAAGRALFWKYAYLDKDIGKYVLCADDQRYINHSTNEFNIKSTPNQDVALRDIEPGEELLCNYNDYDDTYFTRNGLNESELL